ncbi:MAG: hydantoinase/oxoprolinase family protein, partial [Clostridia bacterium]|nr:hydantoinase/oxoprolinase family protein [Clostridia bacterium]
MAVMVGIDIGGTFTDFVWVDGETGRVAVHKRLTTPDDPARAALQGLVELAREEGAELGRVARVVHGTTLVTNAVIERKGACVGLVTTSGMRDAIEIGREQRYDIYDLFLRFPEPLVPRDRRVEVPERLDRDGRELVPLDRAALVEAVAGLVAKGVESLAIVFLHSYRDPRHELEAREEIGRRFPGLSQSLSAEVAPELGEYERTVTTAADAFVRPLVSRYVGRFAEELRARGAGGELLLMQSSGGTATVRMAVTMPVRLLESGPAGGVLAAAHIGRTIGRPDLISFDMGGTTAKACLIEGGRPGLVPVMEAARVHRFKPGSGLPIRTPVVDMIEVGAGGGSIARVDALGLLRVGPESAGADPGPACYGQGGRQPTVTDADLVLGYLNPDFFLGGRLALDVEAAREALGGLARALGLPLEAAAWGVHAVVDEEMAGAARSHVVERGRDPRRYALLAFGGAGPVHAVQVARILGVSEVIVPPAAGAASALGFLVAPLSFDFARSLPARLRAVDWPQVNASLAEMEARGRELLAEAGVQDGVTVERWADMRLVGQVHDIAVPLPEGPLGPERAGEIAQAFTRAYRELYTHVPPGIEIQILNWRVRVRGPEGHVALAGLDGAANEAAAAGAREAAGEGAREAAGGGARA